MNAKVVIALGILAIVIIAGIVLFTLPEEVSTDSGKVTFNVISPQQVEGTGITTFNVVGGEDNE